MIVILLLFVVVSHDCVDENYAFYQFGILSRCVQKFANCNPAS